MGKKEIEITVDCVQHIITICLDGQTYHNLHFAEGFKKFADRLLEVLSEDYEIDVIKEHPTYTHSYKIQ